MERDKQAQITIRDMHKMTKKEVRSLVSWLHIQAKNLERLTAKDQMWLVNRKDYAPIYRMSLMK